MSRVGKLPIGLPSGVTITVDPDTITVAGSKGTLTQFAMPDITVKQEGDQVLVTRANDEPKIRAKHGLMRALLNNMVVDVSTGFSKKLELNGVGFRGSVQGTPRDVRTAEKDHRQVIVGPAQRPGDRRQSLVLHPAPCAVLDLAQGGDRHP